jgi:hypothetical protein
MWVKIGECYCLCTVQSTRRLWQCSLVYVSRRYVGRLASNLQTWDTSKSDGRESRTVQLTTRNLPIYHGVFMRSIKF